MKITKQHLTHIIKEELETPESKTFSEKAAKGQLMMITVGVPFH